MHYVTSRKVLPNNFGLYDMSANAREWVDDCWHSNYENAPSVNRRWVKKIMDSVISQFYVEGHGYITLITCELYRNAYVTSQARSIMWGFRLVREFSFDFYT